MDVGKPCLEKEIYVYIQLGFREGNAGGGLTKR
ncbi:hypothetical protein BH24BAC1_BH24BAC1_29900 [soil metagenome]